MSATANVSDTAADEDNLLTTRVRLTKNEYYATIRNKLEFNRLCLARRHLQGENDRSASKLQTSIGDIRQNWNDTRHVVACLDHFLDRRKVSRSVETCRSSPSVAPFVSRSECIGWAALSTGATDVGATRRPAARSIRVERRPTVHGTVTVGHGRQSAVRRRLVEQGPQTLDSTDGIGRRSSGIGAIDRREHERTGVAHGQRSDNVADEADRDRLARQGRSSDGRVGACRRRRTPSDDVAVCRSLGTATRRVRRSSATRDRRIQTQRSDLCQTLSTVAISDQDGQVADLR
jgi:hypothetical protein